MVCRRLAVPGGSSRSLLVLVQKQGLQFVSGASLQHRLAIGFLQALELAFVLLAHVLRVGFQGIFHPFVAVLHPTLYL